MIHSGFFSFGLEKNLSQKFFGKIFCHNQPLFIKNLEIQFFILPFAIVRINFETTLKIGKWMERLQKIAGLSDGSGNK